MLIECPANTRLQDYLLQNDIHIFDGLRRSQRNCAKCVVRIVKGRATVNTMDQIWFSEERLFLPVIG
ncbi:MAG: ferredoxin [Mediterraneibacter gnavus]